MTFEGMIFCTWNVIIVMEMYGCMYVLYQPVQAFLKMTSEVYHLSNVSFDVLRLAGTVDLRFSQQ
jgi:hypothetical protein